MPYATKPLANRIAIAFDFDDTLVPDSFDTLLESLGIDAQQFRREKYDSLKESGWAGIPARFYSLIQESRRRDQPITRDHIAQFGQQIQPFDGVPEMFDRLRQTARAIVPDVEVEFYLITSGFVEIARHSAIAHEFKAMWGCEFHYDEDGAIAFLKNSVSHPEKPLYLYYLSRGLDERANSDLIYVYQDVPAEKLHVPLSQVIYVGDGTSDLPCFAVLQEHQGIAIGVYKDGTAQDWSQKYHISPSQRVANLAPADYSENSELMQSLTLAVQSMCKQIALLHLGIDE